MSSTRKIVVVGFGNIGQSILPFLREAFPGYLVIAYEQHCDTERQRVAGLFDVQLINATLAPDNVRALLGCLLQPGDFLLNLASEVSSLDLLHIARAGGALYVDAGIEPWQYQYGARAPETSNVALRDQMLALRENEPGGPTAVIAQGANPGFVSVLVKRALWEMACHVGVRSNRSGLPCDREGWAALSAELDVRCIQISEYDSQATAFDRPVDELWNTWSVEGFLAECQQPAEIGWGSHEPSISAITVESLDSASGAVSFYRCGWQTRVRSWSPLRGEFDALVLTHHESISIAQYLTIGSESHPAYRPTVYYAYRPADCALQSAQAYFADQRGTRFRHRVVKDEIVSGVDELGVLLMSARYGGLWYGSALSIERARHLMPLNNATSLQVASSITGAMRWASEHPERGIVETEEIDHAILFDYTGHFWRPIQCVPTNWTPAGDFHRLDFGVFSSDAESATDTTARLAFTA